MMRCSSFRFLTARQGRSAARATAAAASSKKRKRGTADSQGDEGLPPDDGEAEGGGKSAGDGEEIAASFAV